MDRAVSGCLFAATAATAVGLIALFAEVFAGNGAEIFVHSGVAALGFFLLVGFIMLVDMAHARAVRGQRRAFDDWCEEIDRENEREEMRIVEAERARRRNAARIGFMTRQRKVNGAQSPR